MMKKLIYLCVGVGVILNVILPTLGVVVDVGKAQAESVGVGAEVDVGVGVDAGFGSDASFDDSGGGDVEPEAEDLSEELDDEEVKVEKTLGDEEVEILKETVEAEAEEDAAWEPPEIYIKAVNPGYKIDGVSNVGEMIEIARGGDSDAPISLAGTTVSYTNSSGTRSIIFEFPEHSWMAGESILLKLASSPGSELANSTYSTTLAMSAGLELLMDGEVVDEVCWTGKSGCAKAFTSTKPTTLVRNEVTGEFEHLMIYVPEYDEESYVVEVDEDGGDESGDGGWASEKPVVAHCQGLEFSEILSYFAKDKSEQFIELHNSGGSEVDLDGCKMRYKNKKYTLTGAVEAGGYFVYRPEGFSLTKNPTSTNKLEILDADDTVVDTLEYPNGQRKGASYAWVENDEEGEVWEVTYAVTPGAENKYQEFRDCEEGKVINEATGNCVKETVVTEKICKEGYYLNTLTNRCRKVTTTTEKVCKEGYYLNILTGRCKKNPTTTEKTCKEGYYLNPDTGRCRKIVTNDGADYSLEPENYEESSSFVALYAVLGVVGVGAAYLVWEFRRELARFFKKLVKKS